MDAAAPCCPRPCQRRLAEHDATRMEQLCSNTALSTYSAASSSIVSELATEIAALHN
jgi:hypothetical protein